MWAVSYPKNNHLDFSTKKNSNCSKCYEQKFYSYLYLLKVVDGFYTCQSHNLFDDLYWKLSCQNFIVHCQYILQASTWFCKTQRDPTRFCKFLQDSTRLKILHWKFQLSKDCVDPLVESIANWLLLRFMNHPQEKRGRMELHQPWRRLYNAALKAALFCKLSLGHGVDAERLWCW